MTTAPSAPSLQHQAVFCLGGRYAACSRFAARPEANPVRAGASAAIENRRASDAGGAATGRAWLVPVVTLLIAAAAGFALAATGVGNPFDAEPVHQSGTGAAALSATVRPAE